MTHASFPLRKTLARGALVLAGLLGACSSDASICADDETGTCLESVELTYLNVAYDLSRPVYVNNRVPIEFGITATGPTGAETRDVAVSFSFVEAEPLDPANPVECGSSATVLEIVGDGEEHVFYGYVWPTTVCAELAGRPANLRVDFDGGDEAEDLPSGLEHPSVLFRESEQNAAPNRACRKTADPSAADPGRGCVYVVDLQPTPENEDGALIDVRYSDFVPSSSVAVLPDVAPDAEPLPSLLVESTLVVNGRDPYVAAVAPGDVPPELEEDLPGITDELLFGASPDDLDAFTALPGRAVLRFELAPVGDEGFLPLTVGTDAGRVDEVVIEELLPGTPNTFAHELFAEGDTRAALDEGGAWAGVSDFTLRACFEADFAQAGNEGDGDASDCRTSTIVLVREPPRASAASSIGFDAEISRSVGGDRLNLSTTLFTQNSLDRTGASSRIEGNVSIGGQLGRSFSIDVARAFGQANLGVEPGSSGYEVGVDAFLDRIYTFAENSSDEIVHEEEFSAARSFAFPGLGFGFGPVRVGFSFELGGEVSLGTVDALELSVDPDTCAEIVGGEDTLEVCGAISRTVTPGFAFTAAIEGGVDIRIARAGVRAELRIVDTAFPLRAALGFGIGSDGDFSVIGSANWQLELTLIQGTVAIVGRVGIRRFSRSLRVNLFSFSTPTITRTLLDETMDVLALLD
ncbi:MAG: hypothetical protein H6722_22555 [Sandaracinus sp.]|nr:hypothetical protein [Sandaracinus sp.]MCB9620982.1 hypothetical protein [Sandaracinus sp.]